MLLDCEVFEIRLEDSFVSSDLQGPTWCHESYLLAPSSISHSNLNEIIKNIVHAIKIEEINNKTREDNGDLHLSGVQNHAKPMRSTLRPINWYKTLL